MFHVEYGIANVSPRSVWSFMRLKLVLRISMPLVHVIHVNKGTRQCSCYVSTLVPWLFVYISQYQDVLRV